jgi:pimeloyl-ACP methyl ester carboxylesterase
MTASSGERIVRANGVDLCVESFGDAENPPLLLIMGLGASMLHFGEPFCEQLAAGGRFVVRYDHRDTGRSVTYPIGEPGYTGGDLTADAVGILDALGIARAHVAGFSAGGGIAQELGIHHADRLLSLTLISTSPGGSGGELDLPGMDEGAAAEFAQLAEPDWSDRAAVATYLFEAERLSASRTRPVDADYLRDLVERTIDRADSIGAASNHNVMEHGDGDPPSALREIAVPTLVIHGTADPLFPLAHGAALADLIPGASLLALENNGHELPPAVWDEVATAILVHTTDAAV